MIPYLSSGRRKKTSIFLHSHPVKFWKLDKKEDPCYLLLCYKTKGKTHGSSKKSYDSTCPNYQVNSSKNYWFSRKKVQNSDQSLQSDQSCCDTFVWTSGSFIKFERCLWQPATSFRDAESNPLSAFSILRTPNFLHTSSKMIRSSQSKESMTTVRKSCCSSRRAVSSLTISARVCAKGNFLQSISGKISLRGG